MLIRQLTQIFEKIKRDALSTGSKVFLLDILEHFQFMPTSLNDERRNFELSKSNILIF